jgi:hypothetical protein
MIIEPIHTTSINGKSLRFFRPLHGSDRPGLPWFSVDDLTLCMGLPADERRRLLKDLTPRKGWEGPKNPKPGHHWTQIVATADGETIAAPAGVVNYIADSWGEDFTLDVWESYEAAFRKAFDKLTAGLCVEDLCRFLNTAYQWDLAPGPSFGFADARKVTWRETMGGFDAMIDGQWIAVPERAIVFESSDPDVMTGEGAIWYSQEADNIRIDCFMPKWVMGA